MKKISKTIKKTNIRNVMISEIKDAISDANDKSRSKRWRYDSLRKALDYANAMFMIDVINGEGYNMLRRIIIDKVDIETINIKMEID